MFLQIRLKWGIAIGDSLFLGIETRVLGSTGRGARENSGDRDI